MVSEQKKQVVKQVGAQIAEHKVIGIIDMHKLPARQLFQIKNKLKGKATIRMVKKRLITLALKEKKLDGLEKYIQGQPALLLSTEDPFKLAKVISESKSKAAAKAGDIAPYDLVIPAGPTPIPPGPAIGDFQKLKIPCGVEGDKIAVKKDTVVVKKDEVIEAAVANLLAKLGIEPMEIGLNLVAAWEEGTIYENEVLFIPPEYYLDQLKTAQSNAFSLALGIGHFTKETVPVLLGKAHREAVALATEAGVLTTETVKPLLAKAQKQAEVLKSKVKDAPDEKPKEESKSEETKQTEEKKEAQETPTEEKKVDASSEETSETKEASS